MVGAQRLDHRGDVEQMSYLVIARSESDEAIQNSSKTGLLRFARNDELRMHRQVVDGRALTG
jgi:hypothetical protein